MRVLFKRNIKKLYLYSKYNFVLKKSNQNNISNIIMFDGRLNHGGFVDRLKGIITSYVISKKFSNSKFKIFHDSPFKLNQYLVPNEIDWLIEEKELDFCFPNSKVIYNMDDYNFSYLANEIKKNSLRSHGQNHIYTNIDYSSMLFEIGCKYSWKDSFLELFNYSEHMNMLLLKYDTSDCIGIHARFGSILGDFKDTVTFSEINEENKRDVINNSKMIIKKIISKHAHQKVYLFSDSNLFIDESKASIDNIISTPGDPIHTDIIGSEKSHDKTILDFFLLSKCKIVYQLKSKEMYNSQFSKYASIIGSSKFEIIRY